MRWMLDCSTGSLRKHKTSVPYSVLLSNNCDCKRNILAYRKTSIYKFQSGFAFNAFLFLAKKCRQNAPTLRQDVVLSIVP